MSRTEIFEKEVLTVEDIMFLFAFNKTKAYELINQIKRKYDRLKIQGRLHTEDYFEYYGITDKQRYLGGTDNVCISSNIDNSNSD